MNKLLIGIMYLIILGIVYVTGMSKQQNRNTFNNENFYVPVIEEVIHEDVTPTEINRDSYIDKANDIISVFYNSDIVNKREKIVDILRDMIEVDDTTDFLENHPEIHNYIFHSSA